MKVETDEKSADQAAQAMLDAIYGLDASAGFGALSGAMATAVAGYMHQWGKELFEAEMMLDDLHNDTVDRMREVWGQVQRNDC